jgi:hypothetical protein
MLMCNRLLTCIQVLVSLQLVFLRRDVLTMAIESALAASRVPFFKQAAGTCTPF